MGYIWDVYIYIYMGYIWDIYILYMGYIWDVYIYIYGIYMGYIYIWDIYGINVSKYAIRGSSGIGHLYQCH